MKIIRFKTVLYIIAVSAAIACSRGEPYPVVPAPVSIKNISGSCCVPARVSVFSCEESFRRAALTWSESLQGAPQAGVDSTAAGHVRIASGASLPSFSVSGDRKGALVVLLKDASMPEESYQIRINGKGVEIKAASPAGIFMGLQTLTQILLQEVPDARGARRLQGTLIEDAPRFVHRGALLDCSRHFYGVDEVKSFIDILAAHKMNIFHWHLTDDQGWRIEIRKYPRLTTVGSLRRATVVGLHSKKESENTYDGIPYGPYYYTQEQIREIVQYAADRFITVVPEIEMPGHCLGAIAAYPWLSCDKKPKEVSPVWGVFADGVVCPSRESTYRFLEDVLDEVCELFPSEYIHIGGDEAPRLNWKSCADCRRKMKQMGFSREAELQSYLLERIEAYLAGKGRRIIGWDEILDGGATQGATVMCWRGAKWGVEAAHHGNRVIMTPRHNCYLDYYQTEDPVGNGENLAPPKRLLPLEKCYSFDPVAGMQADEVQHVAGLQGNVWCEFISSFDHVQFMSLPRIAALSEVAWSREKDSYEHFLSRLKAAMVPVYEYEGWVYAPYAFSQ